MKTFCLGHVHDKASFPLTKTSLVSRIQPLRVRAFSLMAEKLNEKLSVSSEFVKNRECF